MKSRVCSLCGLRPGVQGAVCYMHYVRATCRELQVHIHNNCSI